MGKSLGCLSAVLGEDPMRKLDTDVVVSVLKKEQCPQADCIWQSGLLGSGKRPHKLGQGFYITGRQL